MAKSQIQQAIDKVDMDISVLQALRAILVQTQNDASKRKAKPKTEKVRT